MQMPLDIAVDIGRIVLEARAASLALNVAKCADDLVSRFPETGLSHNEIVDALKEEADALGLSSN